jgi:hypothetical protein
MVHCLSVETPAHHAAHSSPLPAPPVHNPLHRYTRCVSTRLLLSPAEATGVGRLEVESPVGAPWPCRSSVCEWPEARDCGVRPASCGAARSTRRTRRPVRVAPSRCSAAWCSSPCWTRGCAPPPRANSARPSYSSCRCCNVVRRYPNCRRSPPAATAPPALNDHRSKMAHEPPTAV